MALTDAWQARRIWKWVWFSDFVASSVRRNLRMASGLILFTYIGAHLTNHALGLISLNTAERGMEIAVEVWYSVPARCCCTAPRRRISYSRCGPSMSGAPSACRRSNSCASRSASRCR